MKISDYIRKLSDVLKLFPEQKLEKLATKITSTALNGGTIFVAGNGGSAATASHFVCDIQKTVLGKSPQQIKENRIRVICLNDNVPLMTAWANDTDYAHIFSEPLRNLGRAGDLAIFITGSGNSTNIIEGLKTAKELGVQSHSWLGFDGGKAKGLTDEYILVESDHYGVVEDIHMIMVHLLTELLKETFSTHGN